MSVMQRLQDDMKAAMRSGEKVRLGAIRMTISALKNAKIDGGKELTEAEEVAIVQRAVKQRREAAEAFAKGDRPELAAKETEELEILSAYLPSQMSDAELASAVAEAIRETSATSSRDMGKVMTAVLAKHKGQVDGNRARIAVQQALPPA